MPPISQIKFGKVSDSKKHCERFLQDFRNGFRNKTRNSIEIVLIDAYENSTKTAETVADFEPTTKKKNKKIIFKQ